MDIATRICQHLAEHTYVLSEESPQQMGQRVVRALTSGYNTMLPAYQILDGSESESLKDTLLSLANLTKTYYAVVVPDKHFMALDEAALHLVLAQKRESTMWLNAMRAVTDEVGAEIGQWMHSEASYFFGENEEFHLVRITRS